MVAPIQSLMNMEMALYGGMGTDCNVPSFYNNYMGNSQWNSPMASYPNYFMPNYGNVSFGQQIPYGYANGTQQNVPAAQGLNQSQINALGDFYAQNMDPSQSLFNAVIVGGVSAALMQNPRVLVHPINTVKAFGDVKGMFADVTKEGTKLHELWKNNNVVMEEAYSQMHRAAARADKNGWKAGLFRKKYTADEYKILKETMEEALKKGNIDDIAKATETLRHAYVTNGHIAAPVKKGWSKVSGFLKKVPVIGGFFNDKAPLLTVKDALAQTDVISANKKTLMSYNKMSLKGAFKKTGGWFGLAFGALELLSAIPKIMQAKEQDKENAKNGKNTKLARKQAGQSTVKALANTAGWAVGETLGVWGASKLGATLGTAVAPGLGTVIGAVAGFIGGSLGMWAFGGLAKKCMGKDVADKEAGKKLAQSQEGQVELLQMVYEKSQKGEKIDPNAMAAAQQIMTMYA